MLAGIASLIALSSFLLPSPDERITMLIRDHHTGSAYEELNRLFLKGEREPHLLHQLTKLHEQYGNIESMKTVLLASLKNKSDDKVMREKLIELYFYTHNKQGYITQLERHIDYHGAQKQLDRLLGYHKTLGNVSEEVRLSRKYLFKPFFSNEHAERYAMLLLNSGEQAQGLAVFQKMDDLSHTSDHHWTIRHTMFRYLIDQEQIGEAYQRAMRWASQKGAKESNLIALIEHLSARGLKELALSLGHSALPAHPKLTFTVANQLVDLKRFDLARQMLGQWRQTHLQPDETDLAKYVEASLQAKDLPAALASLNSHGFARAPQRALQALANELIDQNQIPLLKTVLPFLSAQGRSSHPLFSARVALLDGHKNQARTLLRKIDPASLKTDDGRIWLAAYRQAFGLKAAYLRMHEMVARRKLPLKLLRDYADAANLLGRTVKSRWVWSKLGGLFPLNTLSTISEAKDQAENAQAAFNSFDLASNY